MLLVSLVKTIIFSGVSWSLYRNPENALGKTWILLLFPVEITVFPRLFWISLQNPKKLEIY